MESTNHSKALAEVGPASVTTNVARPRPGDHRRHRSVRRRRPRRQLIEAPGAGDHADQAFVGRAESERHRRAVGVAGRYRRSGGESGFGRRPFGDGAGDGQRLESFAEQPRVASEPERLERRRRPSAIALVDEVRRGHVADFEADLARQAKAEIVLAEERPLGAPERLRLVRLEPCDQRQRLAGEQRIVGQLRRSGFGPLGAPALDDRLRPLIGRKDGVAHRPSVAVDEKETVAVAGQADGDDRRRRDAGRGQDLARDVADSGPHGLGIALEKAGRRVQRRHPHRGDRAFGAARVVERRLDGGASCVEGDDVRLAHGRGLRSCRFGKGRAPPRRSARRRAGRRSRAAARREPERPPRRPAPRASPAAARIGRRRDLRADPAGLRAFLDDHHPSGLADRGFRSSRRSSGARLRTSITSASIPSAASCSAACEAKCAISSQPRMVTSDPFSSARTPCRAARRSPRRECRSSRRPRRARRARLSSRRAACARRSSPGCRRERRP